MAISEDKALEILLDLIRKPETQAVDLPRIWSELLTIFNHAFAPVVEETKKKKRRRAVNPNIGWPQGVSRDEYRIWTSPFRAGNYDSHTMKKYGVPFLS